MAGKLSTNYYYGSASRDFNGLICTFTAEEFADPKEELGTVESPWLLCTSCIELPKSELEISSSLSDFWIVELAAKESSSPR